MYKKFEIDSTYYDKPLKFKDVLSDVVLKYNLKLTDQISKDIYSDLDFFTKEFQEIDIFIKNLSTTKNIIEPLFRLYLYSFMLGDTIGYFNGKWEFNNGLNPVDITPEYVTDMLFEFINLGGVNNFDINNLRVSDDSILLLSTARVILQKLNNIDEYGAKLKLEYLNHYDELKTRHPGETTMRSINILKNTDWFNISYNGQDIGNGAVMRSGVIAFFYSPYELDFLRICIETSRITHNSALSILGSISIAYLVHCACYEFDTDTWLMYLIKYLEKIDPDIQKYIKSTRPNELMSYNLDKLTFMGQLKKYYHLKYVGEKLRTDMINIFNNPVRRFKYLSESFSKKNMNMPGSCADDSIIFALDSIIESKGNYEKLIVYSALHPGDSDTVAAISFSLFFLNNNKKLIDSVKTNINGLEYYDQIDEIVNNANNKLSLGFYKNLIFESFLE